MARRDYSEDDDFYTQDFDEDGFVSIWVGLEQPSEVEDTDVLQDLCGVGYYSLDKQESNYLDGALVDLETLLADVSFSETFIAAALKAARAKGLSKARWVTVQFDFKYDPSQVTREIAPDPVFLGYFPYSMD